MNALSTVPPATRTWSGVVPAPGRSLPPCHPACVVSVCKATMHRGVGRRPASGNHRTLCPCDERPTLLQRQEHAFVNVGNLFLAPPLPRLSVAVASALDDVVRVFVHQVLVITSVPLMPAAAMCVGSVPCLQRSRPPHCLKVYQQTHPPSTCGRLQADTRKEGTRNRQLQLRKASLPSPTKERLSSFSQAAAGRSHVRGTEPHRSTFFRNT